MCTPTVGLGIYELDGDSLKLIVHNPGAGRPTDFAGTDRVCVAVHYLGDQCIGSSHFCLDQEGVTPETLRDSLAGLQGDNIRSERFLWSGPGDEIQT